MTIASYLSLAGVWILAISAPGPDTVQLLRLGSRSRRNAVFAALGICTGNIIWPLLSMLGLAALIAATSWALALLYLGGGAFLIYMGIGAIRSGVAGRRAQTTAGGVSEAAMGPDHSDDSSASSSPVLAELSDGAAWRLGLATNLANPKALIFFAAVFAQFLPLDADWGTRALVILMMTVIGVLWFVGFAWFVSLPVWAARLQRYNPIIEIAAGVVFILLGGLLAIEGIKTL